MKLNPWIHHTLLGFGIFNTLIGITLFFYYPKIPFDIISPLIPQAFWAVIFLLSGLVLFYGLITKHNRLLRHMMIFGLFVKLMWEMGFLFRLGNGGTVFSVELWGMIAYIQLLGVIYFNPEVRHGGT